VSATEGAPVIEVKEIKYGKKEEEKNSEEKEKAATDSAVKNAEELSKKETKGNR